MTDVTNSVLARRSTRAFLDKPLDKSIVVDILETARRSPSGSNLQPWFVYALAGNDLDDFREQIRSSVTANPKGESPEYAVYPKDLGEPYRSRKFQCGEDMYATIGIERENKMGRIMQFARNFELFDAPVGLFFCIDRSLGKPQWAHLGMFIQTVMLLAHERGLATCAQESLSGFNKTVRASLNMPEELMLYCGMAVGYADPEAPINSLKTGRAELKDFSDLRGF